MKKIATISVTILIMFFMVSAGISYSSALTKSDPGKTGKMSGRPDAPSGLSGKVLETMDSGGYTYVNLQQEEKSIWVAIPRTDVTAGQDISLAPGMVMSNFTSSTLDRTFETIVFSSGLAGDSGTAAMGFDHGSISTKTGPSVDSTIKVEKASGPDAYTVAELHEKSADLHEKKITVRGQVTKVLEGIMGKTWIHIRDGSGDTEQGTDSITLTSQDVPSVGDVVTAEGTLYKDRDFGSGYRYSVIVEETSISE